ncbi:MAG TPA: hypothetical protein VKJ01_27960 [Candidatus Solibacter sp.]|jgi:hypothetical protein|nr:hypothetical protein [Candidatus Solibacter sp.]
MIPILAAASVFSTIDKVAGAATSEWKQLTATGQGSGKTDTTAAPGSFAALLAQISNK